MYSAIWGAAQGYSWRCLCVCVCVCVCVQVYFMFKITLETLFTTVNDILEWICAECLSLNCSARFPFTLPHQLLLRLLFSYISQNDFSRQAPGDVAELLVVCVGGYSNGNRSSGVRFCNENFRLLSMVCLPLQRRIWPYFLSHQCSLCRFHWNGRQTEVVWPVIYGKWGKKPTQKIDLKMEVWKCVQF